MLTQTLSKKLQLSLNHDLQVTQGWTYQRYHEPSPVPEGSSMMIICISGSTSNVDNHIIDTSRMDLNNNTPASYYACISVLSIRFPWNMVMLMWNSCTPRHLLRSFLGLIVKISARFPWIIWFVGSNLPPLVTQLNTIHLMKLTLIKIWDILKLATFFFICFFCFI